jgi:LuxR family transcriptional regulator, maltose regulon positive regulatory protein
VATAAEELPPGPLLVQSKLQPPTRGELVRRPELVGRLAGGSRRKLTVISAPAGWGKTTLLAEWAASDAETRPFAWLSLDARDAEGARFWTYVVAALRGLQPQLGMAALELLTAPGVDMEREALPVLLNEIETLPAPSVLALDDYHLVDSPQVHAEMSYLVEHLPSVLEVAMTTRTEPPLPLPRMRVRGELGEIDASQLRFSAAESGELLNDVLQLQLGSDQVDSLCRRTEGWAAGLYLAALSLRHQPDASSFIRDFAGDDRHIVDYLASEVLGGVGEEVRDFLVSTSILDRLTAPLCDAVTGREVALRLLPEIERSNLFLIALDERREWYRYHHLFGELLRRELDPDLEPELHRRAAGWFLSRGDADGGIRHTIAAGDHAAAAELVAEHWTAWLLERGEHGSIDAWLAALPEELVRSDARLCVARVFVGHSTGRMDGLEPWLAAADEALAARPDPRVAVEVAAAHSSHRILTGDARGANELATPAIEQGDRRSLWYPVPFGARAHARRWSGDLEGAVADFDGYMRESAERNQVLSVISTIGSLALIHAEAGRWGEAEEHAKRALELTQHALSEHWMMGGAHTALALLHAERGDRAAALAAGERAVELVRRGAVPGDRANTLLAVAALRAESGDEDGASELVREARELVDACPDPGAVVLERLARAERAPSRPGPAAAPELSERELAVLRLLASELSQREIGNELYVSLNTVKTHTRNIFRKLGVSTRDEATARARELGLIG